jgi:hypothetical protein
MPLLFHLNLNKPTTNILLLTTKLASKYSKRSCIPSSAFLDAVNGSVDLTIPGGADSLPVVGGAGELAAPGFLVACCCDAAPAAAI